MPLFESSVRIVKAALGTPAALWRRARDYDLAAYGLPGMTMPQVSTPSTTEAVGVPGTQNVFGYITGEDYNPNLDGYKMFPLLDEMRRSDAQVNASLMQIKLPLKAARRIIKPASDDPQDVAIADFVNVCLLSDGAFERSISSVMDNALLRFDFGCSAEEIVWTNEVVRENDIVTNEAGLAARAGRGYAADDVLQLADTSAIKNLPGGSVPMTRFKDISPRLPRTFFRWIVDPVTRKLQYLEQYAPGVNGAWNTYDIPGPAFGIKDRLILHAHQKEGDNFYGRSVLRAAYAHYFYKKQLLNIDMVRHDRFGAGIPIAKLTADYKANQAPLDKIEETLSGLRSHERSYAIQPWGVEYGLLSAGQGSAETTDIIKSVQYHDTMIAQNVLQQFSTQGMQRHGSFGAAKVSSEAFYDSLSGAAEEIAEEFTVGAIRKLCDANFDMTGRAYPQFAFADIATADTAAISDYVSKLVTAGAWTPEDDGEQWLRELVDAPALPEALKGRDRTPPKPVPSGPNGGGDGSEVPTDDGGAPVPVNASTRTGYQELGRTFSREPSAFERQVFDLHGVPARLDDLQANLVRKMSAIRKQQLVTVAARIAQKDGRKTPAFTDIRHAHVTMPGQADMVKAIRSAQATALAYGRQTVQDELGKQGVKALAVELGPAAAGRQTTTSSLVSSAKITARKQADAWQSRILDTGLRLRRNGLQGEELAKKIVDDLDDEIESGAKRDAASEINEAFGLGRAGAANDFGDSLETATYSALLDANTCDVCAELDGEEFAADSPELAAVMPPNPGCLGGDACRCVVIWQAKEQAA